MQNPVQIAAAGGVTGGGQQHGGVAIVAAGMHHPRDRRRMGQPRQFLDRQGVHVGTQRDRPPGMATPQRAHDPGAPQTADHLIAELGQLAGNEGRCPVFLKGDLGVAVQVMPPAPRVFDKTRIKLCNHL
jgi:hypothetical protein